MLGSLYPPLKDLGLLLRHHHDKLLRQLVDVLEVIPCLADDFKLLALPFGELVRLTDKQPRHLARGQTLAFWLWRGRGLAKGGVIKDRTIFPHPSAFGARNGRMHPP